MIDLDRFLSRKRQTQLRQGLQKAQKVLTVVTGIADKLPTPEDEGWTRAAKIIGVVGAFSSLVVRPDDTPGYELINHLEDHDYSSWDFRASLLTRIAPNYNPRHIKLDSHSYEEWTVGKGKILVHLEDKDTPNGIVYVQPTIDMEEIVEQVWESHSHQIEMTWFDRNICYDSFRAIPHPMYGKDKERLESLVQKHRRVEAQDKSLTYMFHGLPGTGKTSFAHVFASRIGGRLLRVTPTVLNQSPFKRIMNQVAVLAPDILLIDEFDKLSDNGLADMLLLLEELRQQSRTSVILTGNQVDQFDRGFFRPGRITTWVEFKVALEDEPRVILESYLGAQQLVIAESELSQLVKLTDGLSNDYLRDAVDRLTYMTFPEMCSDIETMRAMLNVASNHGVDVSPEMASCEESEDEWG